MEGCAETLIPNPQKPRSALITEDAAAPFFKSLRGLLCKKRSIIGDEQ